MKLLAIFMYQLSNFSHSNRLNNQSTYVYWADIWNIMRSNWFTKLNNEVYLTEWCILWCLYTRRVKERLTNNVMGFNVYDGKWFLLFNDDDDATWSIKLNKRKVQQFHFSSSHWNVDAVWSLERREIARQFKWHAEVSESFSYFNFVLRKFGSSNLSGFSI